MIAAPPKLLNTTAVAEILQVTQSRVRQLCLQGQIGQKLGEIWYFTEDEIRQFQPVHKRKPGPPKKNA